MYCGNDIKTYKSVNKKYCNLECRNNGYVGIRRAPKVDAGYSAVHKWMTATFGKPEECENCGKSEKIQWANKSGEYLRDRSDWLHLCVWCHLTYDGTDIQSNGGRWGKTAQKL